MDNINNGTLTEPKEKYTFSFTAQEAAMLGKKAMRNLNIKGGILLAVLAALALYVEFSPEHNENAYGLLFIFVLIGFISVYRVNKKAWKRFEENIPKSVYGYDVYDDHFEVSISRDEETVHWQKVGFSQVTAMDDCGGIIRMTFTGQTWLLRRSELTPESVFFSLLSKFTTAKPRYKDLRLKK